jgi:aspartyl aminopeptidase
MDNLVSVHAGLLAVIAAPVEAEHIAVFAAFDHEEVGSASRSGAAGPFLADVIARIADGLGATESQRLRSIAASWHVSSDAGHSVHPNYPERHDPANRPVMGRGPLLKINANQRYATDAVGAAEWARSCAQAGVAYQEFVSNNAMPCGSTIGPITATRLGIRTVDIGVPLLSMHSARELCAVEDPGALTAALTAFLAPTAA